MSQKRVNKTKKPYKKKKASTQTISKKEQKRNQLRAIFNKYSDKRHWKNPFTAYVLSLKEAETLGEAIIWFHATKPIITETEILIEPHPDALTALKTNGYKIESKGYDAY